jgi:hypothetical protein
VRAPLSTLTIIVVLSACGDDAEVSESTTDGTSGPVEDEGTSSSTREGSTHEDAVETTETTAGEADTSSGPADATAEPGAGPTITQVRWEHAPGCQSPQEREITITVEVDPGGTRAADLSFSGGVAGCAGDIDAAVSSVTCSGASPAIGSVTVSAPDGQSDDIGFTILVCEDGEVQP